MQIFKSGRPARGAADGAGPRLRCRRGGAVRAANAGGFVPTVLADTDLFLGPVPGRFARPDLFKSDDDVPVRNDVRASAPVVIVFDEFSVETLMTPDGGIDAERPPQLRRAGAVGHLVPQRHHHLRPHHRRRALRAHRPLPRPRSALPPPPTTHTTCSPCSAGPTRCERHGAGHRSVSERLRGRPGAADLRSAVARKRTSASWRCIGSCRSGWPRSFPAVNQGFGNFAAQARDAPAGWREWRSRVSRSRTARAVQPLHSRARRRPAAQPQLHPRPARTRPGSTCRPGSSTRRCRARRCRVSTHGVWSKDPALPPSRPSSASCFRSATSTACSAA